MAAREITRYHIEGQARFAVIKKETAVVFDQFNAATGANLQVFWRVAWAYDQPPAKPSWSQ